MKLLIIGLGSIGQRHYRNLRFLGFSDIAVYRTSKGASDFIKKFEEEYRPAVFHDLTEAFRTGPEAVFIANPTVLHTEFISAALRHGARGIFVEKPIGHKVSSTEVVVAEAEKKNIIGYVGYNFRFHPLLQKMKTLVDEGFVGKVISASVDSGEYLPDWHPWEDYRATYPARRALGGGVVLTQSHDLDYLYWFFGMPKRVAAFGGTKTGLEIDADDLVKGLLEYSNGVVVSLHMDFYQRPPRRIFEIMGTKGTLCWNYHGKKMEFTPYGSKEQPQVWTDPEGFERNIMFLDELRHFFACIEGREQPRVTFRDGLQVLRIVEALLRSVEKGEVVTI
ncbi:MAG: Gfo/Idh/MocA family oxidoreductase [bacterium]|nr:Gfo/Idh/MocA family oxidoreductase [bacterium]